MSRAAAAEPQRPEFCIEYDGARRRAFLVGDWPPVALVSVDFLTYVDPAYLRQQGDRLYFHADNGEAEYVIVGETVSGRSGRPVFRCARLYARREDVGG